MLKPIEGFGKYVVITGFRDARLGNVDTIIRKAASQMDAEEIVFQFFNAKLVATWRHLYFAVLNALKAFKNGENISRNLSMEILLYASAQRQIRKAVNMLGISLKTPEIALIIVGDTVNRTEAALTFISKVVSGKGDEQVLEITEEKKKLLREAFGISDVELDTMFRESEEDTLVDLIIERVALLAAQR